LVGEICLERGHSSTRDSRHIRKFASLPELHKDPFDRILVAQALTEGLTLATKDAMLARYGAPIVWD